MKQNKILIVALTAGMLSSCLNKEETIIDPGAISNNPNAISFMGTTTRANINTLAQLESGFQVFGTGLGVATWYSEGGVTIDGTFDYLKPTTKDANISDFNGWQWRDASVASTKVEAPSWPTFTAGTMEFYALYPINEDLATSANTNNSDMKSTVSIKDNRYEQIDHLAARASVSVKPAGGLSLRFNHILSKVNIKVTAGEGLTVDVQSATLRNVEHAEEKYDYTTATTDDQDGWGDDTDSDKAYKYYESVFAGSATATTDATKYMEYHKDGTTFDLIQFNDKGDAVATNDVAGNLMLIPQVHAVSDLTDVQDNADEITGGASPYIEVIYRVYKTTGGEDVVGRSNIKGLSAAKPYYSVTGDTTYVDWADADLSGASGIFTDSIYPGYTTVANQVDYINNGEAQANEHLYIKALFPIKSENPDAGVDWARGKGYVYNLMIGGSGGGGYYADNQYYDETGRGTGLYHIGTNSNGGDPVFSNRIHFDVSIEEWDNTTAAEPLN